jgi:hypothetical protein
MGKKTKFSRHITHMNVLPGEPLDGSGRVCIHLFVPDEKGLFVEPNILYPDLDESGKRIGRRLVAKPTRGRLACDSKRTVATIVKNGVIYVTPRTNVWEAVTCLKCKKSKEYQTLAAPTMSPVSSPALVSVPTCTPSHTLAHTSIEES